MRALTLSVVLAALLPEAAIAQAEEQPRAILDKAVKAYGGETKLARLRKARAKLKGTVEVNGRSVEFTSAVVVELPGRLRSEWRMEAPGRASSGLTILNGDKGWLRAMDRTTDLDGARLADLKEEAYASGVETLLPLFKDKACTLTALGESKVNGKAVLGIKVAARGHKDIELHFDKTSGLLLKISRPVLDVATMKDVRRDSYYSDFRAIDGLQHPHKVRVDQDGKKHMAMEVVEIKLVDKLDEREFARP
jgi:hypothetical protein